jgi:hypothetical protein
MFVSIIYNRYNNYFGILFYFFRTVNISLILHSLLMINRHIRINKFSDLSKVSVKLELELNFNDRELK